MPYMPIVIRTVFLKFAIYFLQNDKINKSHFAAFAILRKGHAHWSDVCRAFMHIKRFRPMSHLQFSRAILSRECATKSRDKVAYAERCDCTLRLCRINKASFRIIQ